MKRFYVTSAFIDAPHTSYARFSQLGAFLGWEHHPDHGTHFSSREAARYMADYCNMPDILIKEQTGAKI